MKDRLINIFVWLVRLDMENYAVDHKKKSAILNSIVKKEKKND